jgi:hypothetical protein
MVGLSEQSWGADVTQNEVKTLLCTAAVQTAPSQQDAHQRLRAQLHGR